MRITIQKTGAIARSIAYQAKAIMDDIDIVAVFGSTADEARSKLIEGLHDIKSELDELLASEDV